MIIFGHARVKGLGSPVGEQGSNLSATGDDLETDCSKYLTLHIS